MRYYFLILASIGLLSTRTLAQASSHNIFNQVQSADKYLWSVENDINQIGQKIISDEAINFRSLSSDEIAHKSFDLGCLDRLQHISSGVHGNLLAAGTALASATMMQDKADVKVSLKLANIELSQASSEISDIKTRFADDPAVCSDSTIYGVEKERLVSGLEQVETIIISIEEGLEK